MQIACCHELTHACTSHLKLPKSFNEGLAMIMVDKFMQKTTVQESTLEILEQFQNKEIPPEEDRTNDDWLLLYARGYWRARFIMETQTELFKTLLSKPYIKEEFKKQINNVYGNDKNDLWNGVDQRLIKYFK